MSGMVIKKFDFVFNSVQFGIDLRSAREKNGVAQRVVGLAVGWESGASVNALENARYDESLSVEKFLALCNLFDLHANDYFEIEPSETIDLLRRIG